MLNIDYYASVGYALELLSQSEYHSQHSMGTYLQIEFLPALWLNQTRFYITKDRAPVGLVTWAWLNERVEQEVHRTGRFLQPNEWKCGSRLFFYDWITPYNNVREVRDDMTNNVFPNEIATSLRRRRDGSVRRINRWTGVNVRRSNKKDRESRTQS